MCRTKREILSKDGWTSAEWSKKGRLAAWNLRNFYKETKILGAVQKFLSLQNLWTLWRLRKIQFPIFARHCKMNLWVLTQILAFCLRNRRILVYLEGWNLSLERLKRDWIIMFLQEKMEVWRMLALKWSILFPSGAGPKGLRGFKILMPCWTA